MQCVECRKAELQLVSDAVVPVTVKGETFNVSSQALRCVQCGFVTVPGGAMGALMLKGADAYRTAHGLLTREQLRRARKRLNLSLARFAAYLGIGIATLKRWERGEIQSTLHDQIVRWKTDPEAAEFLVQEVYRRLAVGDRVRRGRTVAESAEDDALQPAA